MNSVNVGKSKGLGDTIAKALKKIGIKQCSNCSVRVDKLNDKFPYNNK